MSELILLDSFDHYATAQLGTAPTNETGKWTAKSASGVVISSAAARTGVNGVQFTTVGNSLVRTLSNTSWFAPSSYHWATMGFAVRMATAVSSTVKIAEIEKASLDKYILYVTAAGVLEIRHSENGGAEAVAFTSSATTINDGSWHYIDFQSELRHAAAASGLHRYRLAFDGVMISPDLGAVLAQTGSSSFAIVWRLFGASTNMHVDDAILFLNLNEGWQTVRYNQDVFLPGPISIHCLLPNGTSTDGDSANDEWTVVGAAAKWQAIDDATPNGDTDRIQYVGTGANFEQAFGVPQLVTPSTVIRGGQFTLWRQSTLVNDPSGLTIESNAGPALPWVNGTNNPLPFGQAGTSYSFTSRKMNPFQGQYNSSDQSVSQWNSYPNRRLSSGGAAPDTRKISQVAFELAVPTSLLPFARVSQAVIEAAIRNAPAEVVRKGGPACFECEAHDNGGHGFIRGRGYHRCIAYANGANGFHGPILCNHCTSHANGFSGYKVVHGIPTLLNYCIGTENTIAAFDFSGDPNVRVFAVLRYCAWGISGTDTKFADNPFLTPTVTEYSTVILTADPYASAALGNFSPNTAEGGGLLIRGAGISPLGWEGYIVSYHDIGAIQHQCDSPDVSVNQFTDTQINRSVN